MQDLEGVLRALATLMLDQEPCRIKLLEAKALPAVVAALGAPSLTLPPRRAWATPVDCWLQIAGLRARADRTGPTLNHLQSESSLLASSVHPRDHHLLTLAAWCLHSVARSVPLPHSHELARQQRRLIQLFCRCCAVMTGQQRRLPAGGTHPQRVQAAAADCVRALSRSAKNLRLMLCNARIAEPLVAMLGGGDTQAAASACAALCNLVLDFSSFKVRRQRPPCIPLPTCHHVGLQGSLGG